MATAERDYYEVLGLARGASDGEIKKAFRRLARELHPDVSDAPDAGERFREIAEAYEVLSNAEARALYDRYGHAGLRRGGFTPSNVDFGNLSDIFAAFFGDDLFGTASRGRSARGGDVAATVEIELTDAAVGVTRRVDFEVSVGCETCGETGAEPGTEPSTCPVCGGAGLVQQVSRSLFGEFVRTHTCPRCNGAGRMVEHPCPSCHGSGRVVRGTSLDVEVPPGIHDGQRIRLRGEGHAGGPSGQAGDLFVQVRVRPHPQLVRDGDDVHATARLTVVQAALGATVAVQTLDGETELELEPGTQPGEVRVLRGKGMPLLQGFRRGDLHVHLDVVVPRRLTAEQRSLLEQFERASGEDTYRHDEGFFERLKSAFH